MGLAARHHCLKHGMRFTTSYHTQFPQYLRARFPIPIAASYWALRRFHGAGVRCMVSTPNLRRELASRGFENLATWRRGVDTAMFKPRPKGFLDLPRPIAAFVGRVAIERRTSRHSCKCPGRAAKSSSAMDRSGQGSRRNIAA